MADLLNQQSVLTSQATEYQRNGQKFYSDGNGYGITPEAAAKSNTQKLVQDSGDGLIKQLADQLGLKLDSTTKDYLIQYYLGQKSDDAAMQRSLKLSEDQYASLVRGLRSAGLNPFLALQGLSGANAMTGQGVNGGLYTQKEASQRQQKTQQLATGGSILSTILMAIALVVAHVL